VSPEERASAVVSFQGKAMDPCGSHGKRARTESDVALDAGVDAIDAGDARLIDMAGRLEKELNESLVEKLELLDRLEKSMSENATLLWRKEEMSAEIKALTNANRAMTCRILHLEGKEETMHGLQCRMQSELNDEKTKYSMLCDRLVEAAFNQDPEGGEMDKRGLEKIRTRIGELVGDVQLKRVMDNADGLRAEYIRHKAMYHGLLHRVDLIEQQEGGAGALDVLERTDALAAELKAERTRTVALEARVQAMADAHVERDTSLCEFVTSVSAFHDGVQKQALERKDGSRVLERMWRAVKRTKVGMGGAGASLGV